MNFHKIHNHKQTAQKVSPVLLFLLYMDIDSLCNVVKKKTPKSFKSKKRAEIVVFDIQLFQL